MVHYAGPAGPPMRLRSPAGIYMTTAGHAHALGQGAGAPAQGLYFPAMGPAVPTFASAGSAMPNPGLVDSKSPTEITRLSRFAAGSFASQPAPALFAPSRPSIALPILPPIPVMAAAPLPQEAPAAGVRAPQSPQEPAPLTTMKEKNAMCLINELCKYNKITHCYHLMNESGPAHAKVFHVTLKIGEVETYAAVGPSIKKAQHNAATVAWKETKLKRPPQRQPRKKNGILTPTVELNALATQRGMPVEYEVSRNQERELGSSSKGLFSAVCRVMGKDYIGVAKSAQAAKHRAAAKALDEFRLVPDDRKRHDVPIVMDNPDALGGEGKSPVSQIYELALQRDFIPVFEVVQETGPAHLKNFVTRLQCGDHEALGEGNSKKLSKKRAAERMLDLLASVAPLPPDLSNPAARAHKKKSKPTAAVASPASPASPVQAAKKKRSRNLVKDPKAYPDYGENIHPVSRLIQVTQARHDKDPVYTLVAEKGLPRHREFTIQVTVGDLSCMATGPKKKAAKRAAAERLLELMGFARSGPQPDKSALKNGLCNGPSSSSGSEPDNRASSKPKRVSFKSQDVTALAPTPARTRGRGGGGGRRGGRIRKSPLSSLSIGEEIPHGSEAGGRQLAPGLLLLGRDALSAGEGSPSPQDISSCEEDGDEDAGEEEEGKETSAKREQILCAKISRELLHTGISPTASKLKPKQAPGQLDTAKAKLAFLAAATGLALDFTNFPVAKNSEHVNLAYLALSSQPLVATGKGPTLEDSHEAASYGALKMLSALELDEEEDPPSACLG